MQEPRRLFALYQDDANAPGGQRLLETMEFDSAVDLLAGFMTGDEADNAENAWEELDAAFWAVFANGNGNPDIRFGDDDEFVLSPWKYDTNGPCG